MAACMAARVPLTLPGTTGGADAGDGVSVRAHGDTKPRRACRRRSPRTRFVIAPAPAPPVAATATATATATTAATAAVAPTCIALGVATRARSAKGRASKLPLFRILLPSLLETIETGAASPERFEVHGTLTLTLARSPNPDPDHNPNRNPNPDPNPNSSSNSNPNPNPDPNPNPNPYPDQVHVGHDDDDPWWSVPRNRANAAALATRVTRGHAVSGG